MHKLKNQLIELGYHYFLFDNCESAENGKDIFHYSLHPAIEYIPTEQTAILLDSPPGEEVLDDFLTGNVKIHLLKGSTMRINKNGVVYVHDEFKTL